MPLATRIAIAALALYAANAPADVSVTIVGNVATAEIALPSVAVPTYTATLRLEFSSPENLSVENLGIDAFIISPAAIQPRLPGLDVTVPTDFPVLIRVEPPSRGLQLPKQLRRKFDSNDKFRLRQGLQRDLTQA